MKAIIETGGKQYYVSEGATIYVEKLEGNEGDKVVFDKVLMANGVVGNPYVEATVEGTIVKQGKQKKITIFRYTPNKRSTRRKVGHRQPYTKVEINKIIIDGHANYDVFGKDIVCASVSSTVITTVNILLSLDDESIKYDETEGLIIEVLKNNEITRKVINVLISNLYELERAYPKNIQIKEENNE